MSYDSTKISGSGGDDVKYGGAKSDILDPSNSNAQPRRNWWDQFWGGVGDFFGSLFGGGGASNTPAPNTSDAIDFDEIIVTASRIAKEAPRSFVNGVIDWAFDDVIGPIRAAFRTPLSVHFAGLPDDPIRAAANGVVNWLRSDPIRETTNAIATGFGDAWQEDGLVGVVNLGAYGAGRYGIYGAAPEMRGGAAALDAESMVLLSVRSGRTAEEFVGPVIGRSGFRSSTELAEAVGVRYQRYVDEGYELALAQEARGLLDGPANARVGNYADRYSERRLDAWLEYEGVPEGPYGMVQVKRWLRDPSGSGLYVVPDVRIPAAGAIYDGTLQLKWGSDQVIRFQQFSGGDRVTIIRPPKWTHDVYGSYSLLP